MNRKWLLDLGYLSRLSLVTVVTANCISVDLKVFHIVIEDL
jgi:hypothetical protein